MKNVKKALNYVLNRLVITTTLIIIQMGLLAFYVLKLADYSTWIAGLLAIGALSMTLFVIWRDDNPAYKIGWILLICMLPILGGMMYGFFGNKRPSKSLKRKLEPVEEEHWKDLKQRSDLKKYSNLRRQSTMQYIANTGRYPAWDNSQVDYFESGEKLYEKLIPDLKSAKRFIFIEFFIINEGRMWREIFNVLKEKSAEGVDVRIIYDDVGSIRALPKGFIAETERAGIKVLAFNPLKPFVSLIYNNRDHRKFIVIDGVKAYSGGINIADEYINAERRFGYWKDTGIKVQGQAVWNFTIMFLNMWNAFRPTDRDYEPFGPDGMAASEDFDDGEKRKGYVQPYSDTPLDEENLGENVYLEIISCAERYLYIFTPYLIIDNEMKTALTLAAKRGVEVVIVTPGIPDKRFIHRLTRSYYEPLLRAGVRIFEYSPGFIHAKSFIADDCIGVVGTINMDFRSLYLHFECGTLLVDTPCLADLKRDCIDTMAASREIRHKDCRRSVIGLLIDSILRALSPLL